MAAAPTAFLQARYSRDLEREADAYAVAALHANDISIERFARILERLESVGHQEGKNPRGGVLDYLSSHPVTSERLQALRNTKK